MRVVYQAPQGQFFGITQPHLVQQGFELRNGSARSNPGSGGPPPDNCHLRGTPGCIFLPRHRLQVPSQAVPVAKMQGDCRQWHVVGLISAPPLRIEALVLLERQALVVAKVEGDDSGPVRTLAPEVRDPPETAA